MNKLATNNWIRTIKIRFSLLFIGMLSILWLSGIGTAIAAETITLDGSLQGASCVHYKKKCPETEMHLAMEKDFVLLLGDGTHFFLPNLSRVTKARFATKDIRVTGQKGMHEIWVEKLEVNDRGNFREVWKLSDQEELYKGGGG